MHDQGPVAEETAGTLVLGIHGFSYPDLFVPARLRELSEVFDGEVAAADPELFAEWSRYRADPGAVTEPPRISDLMMRMARELSRFLSRMFGNEEERGRAEASILADEPIFRFRIEFLRRRVVGRVSVEMADEAARAEDDRAVGALVVGGEPDEELAIARAVCDLMDAEAASAATPAGEGLEPGRRARIEVLRRRARAASESGGEALRDVAGRPDEELAALLLDLFARWSAARLAPGPRREAVRGWAAFRLPGKIDFARLVPTVRSGAGSMPDGRTGEPESLRARDGFRLTDLRMAPRDVLSEVHYCIYCHEREKDSCARGLRAKDGTIRRNPLGIDLGGCPLEERISEAHMLKRRGDPLAALAVVMVDNPMCPGTGHRICNDCMKGCIYQTQDPVNIPQVETAALTDVLAMPWGVEIYGLLTRWNPLNVRRPFALPYNGRKVLVVGVGPAGYTLAQYLLNEGFGVVGVDGLKIEPLPVELTGSERSAPRPIRDFSEIRKELDERVLAGFGGVSEYGITVRWDKNFLTLVHLTLARRSTFRVHGGVRFGGTLDLDDAWALGFHHVAIAAGAGRPTVVGMKNALVRGVRQASDFLMALQLTGAFKRDALASLQVRLPAVVIGGGLTAIDAATEVAAYYPVQVEKLLARYEELAGEIGEAAVRQRLDAEEREVLDESIAHGRAVRAERARAAAEGRAPDLLGLVKRWGGVTLAYRRTLEESPAYRLNHEEVIKSLEEGIVYLERVEPLEALADPHGAVSAVRFARRGDDGRSEITVPARTVLIAAGTVPNITYEKENAGTFLLDGNGRFFRPHRAKRAPEGWRLEPVGPGERGSLTSYEKNGRFVSFYGDNHPAYAGSVVKAMASARDGYPQVVELFREEIEGLDPREQRRRDSEFLGFARELSRLLDPRVHEVRRLTPTIVDVVVEAPLAARKFRPGQFYRLQNYETDAPVVRGTRLTLEGLALTGAWVDRERGLLSLIVLEMGASSRLCAALRPGQRVVVMGPTGSPTEIPRGEKVLLVGGGLGNAVLFSIARALEEAGSRVVYFAGYRRGEDLFKREEIEAACDQVVWSTDGGEPIDPRRAQDRHFRGNLVESMLAYAEGRLGEALVPLREVSRVIVIGSDRMMAAVKEARHGVLAPHLRPDHVAIASVNSPMQCMMKEVCAQCLQRHVDPVTGEETYVFSCFNQDQRLDWVDFTHLAQRLRSNSLQEKLADLWLSRRLSAREVTTV